MKPCLVHTLDGQNWRVFFGLIIDEWREEMFAEMRTRAFVAYAVGDGFQFTRIEHIQSLCSGHYYCHWNEAERMLADISYDVKKRCLWPERLTELRAILATFGKTI